MNKENRTGDFGYIVCKDTDINQCNDCRLFSRNLNLNLDSSYKCDEEESRYVCEIPCFEPFEI